MKIDENKTTSLCSHFSVNGEISDSDTRFMSITIDLMHTGKNLNGSCFSKDVVDECIDSIKNTPVLGFIKRNEYTKEEDFLGHEHSLVKTEDGVEERYLGSCYGVIPESCNPRWFTKMCDDGVEREFLQVDALLWEKFADSTGILRRDGEKSESMELEVSSIEGYEDDDGVFHFTKFKFDGACILGDGIEPAMIGANVKMKDVQFAADEFMRNIQDELSSKFTTFTNLVSNRNEQGGVGNMSKQDTEFTQTVIEQFNDIRTMVAEYATMRNRWGEDVPRFAAIDVQDDEVIAVDMQDSYRYYGFKFSISGDKPEIDFESKSRKKITYSDYEEDVPSLEGAFDFGEHISAIEDAAVEKVSDAEAKLADEADAKAAFEAEYDAMKSELDEMKPKYEEYVQAEAQREADELNAQKDAKFAEYEEALSDSAEFEALKENKADMSVDDIESQCAVLFAKAYRQKMNFSKQNSDTAVVGVMEDSDDNASGYVSTRYGKIHIER